MDYLSQESTQGTLYWKKTTSILAIVALAFSATPINAKTKGHDHPAFDPMPGAVIENYDFVDYEVASLLLSKPYYENREVKVDETLELEGKVTYIHYQLPKKYSSLQTYRNYQKLVKKQGMEILYACERPCFDRNLSELDDIIQNHRDVYLNGFEEVQYLAAKKGNLYLSLFVNVMSKQTNVFQFVIEAGDVDDDLLSPMAYELQANGSIDLYGIYFDSGKSTLKAESKTELEELSTVLDQFPELQIEVIGHTDSQGSSSSNKKLSMQRAQSVTKQLNVQYGIASNRLDANGLGEDSPVADNGTADGRAKNRRVEIVAINPEVLAGIDPNFTEVESQELANEEEQPEDNDEFDELVDNVEKASKLGNALKSFF